MAINFTAAQVPIPRVVSTFKLLSDYDVTTQPSDLISAQGLAAGSKVWSNKFNQNAAYLDILAQTGGGRIGILNGLAISAGSGLTLNIALGTAVIDGVVQLDAATTLAMTNSGNNFIWLKNDGTLEAKFNTTTPPTELAVFLGIAVTSGGSITSIDTSGVVYIYGGIAFRQTADAGVPGDAPPSTWQGLTKTASGAYLWDSTAYRPILTASENAEVVQDIVGAMATAGSGISVSYNDAGASLTLTFVTPTVQHADPVNTETLSGTKTLTITDKNVQVLNPDGSTRKVLLPANASITYGMWYRVYNNGTSGSLQIKDSTDSTLIITLAVDEFVTIIPRSSGGTLGWPSTLSAGA